MLPPQVISFFLHVTFLKEYTTFTSLLLGSSVSKTVYANVTSDLHCNYQSQWNSSPLPLPGPLCCAGDCSSSFLPQTFMVLLSLCSSSTSEHFQLNTIWGFSLLHGLLFLSLHFQLLMKSCYSPSEMSLRSISSSPFTAMDLVQALHLFYAPPFLSPALQPLSNPPHHCQG